MEPLRYRGENKSGPLFKEINTFYDMNASGLKKRSPTSGISKATTPQSYGRKY